MRARVPRLKPYLYSRPFSVGIADLSQLFLAYQPDSHATFKAHPEYRELYTRFIEHNATNNAGDIPRLWSLILNGKQVLDEGIAGDFAELGVWRGNTAAVLAQLASRVGRKVLLFDTFEGFSKADLAGIDADKTLQFDDTSIALVKGVIGENERYCEFVKGYFPDSIREQDRARTFAMVSLDCDLYEPMKAGLEFFYPRMSRGGVLFLHDYSSGHWNGAKQAIDEFSKATGEFVILMPDKSGSAFVRKTL